MTRRFEAEQLVRDLASGDLPSDGDLLVRDEKGWVFEDVSTALARVQQSALTAKDTSTVDATYGNEERDVIGNNRTRIEEIEAVLQAVNLLP